ncbi:hypothetical protein [Solitalea canadensis]|uniref:Uncharacterized protein n=1 Tax=Solitalea canadensis (strain ATCC 29591 / DSM 3403 / JCM 21819 / LMG 8368 / NBRC 15130 / NCIMB 12057 / USAM 9D) TaxID=929556 RepID=H8KX08_SOLCM|nr:hypothetical protein [Solitalea canadensis]AFD08337.1 hypothetical protein Solca_3330 [Solitalea canadensis DSM 3403]
MNFDDLKSAWNNDSDNNIEVPKNLDSLKGAQSPIDKVKKNLRSEFWLNVVFIILFFALPFIIDRLVPMSTVLYYTILILTALPMTYYLINFYKFYGRINKLEVSTKDSLNEVYFELKHFIEIYKVMQHFISPNFLLMGFIIGIGPKVGKLLDKLVTIKDLHSDGVWLGVVILGAFIVVMVGFYFYINAHIKYFYGKYLTELGKIRDELKED